MAQAPTIGLAIICRRVRQNDIQVLLHKTPKAGDQTQRSWAFVGGAVRLHQGSGAPQPEDVLRQVEYVLQKDSAGPSPSFSLQASNSTTTRDGKTYIYCALAIPQGHESWPHGQFSEALQVGSHYYQSQGPFCWVDFVALLEEATNFKGQNRNPSMHANVLQWISSYGHALLTKLGGSTRISPAGPDMSQAHVGGGGGGGGGQICRTFASGQNCRFGAACKFSHALTPGGGAVPLAAGGGAPSNPADVFASVPASLPAVLSRPAVDPQTPALKQLAEAFLTTYINSFNAGQAEFFTLYDAQALLSFGPESHVGGEAIAAKFKALHAQGMRKLDLVSVMWHQIAPTGTMLVSAVLRAGTSTTFSTFHLIQPAGAWAISNHIWLS